MNMHATPIKADWSKMKPAQKIEAIASVYGPQHNTARTIAIGLSNLFGITITKSSVMSIYRVHFEKPESPLKKCPLMGNPINLLSDEGMILAEKLWREGLSGTVIAKKLGVGMRQIYSLADTRRDRFPRRTINKAISPGVVVLTMPRADAESPPMKPDRVLRITFSGARVTMPRVTFIDGPA